METWGHLCSSGSLREGLGISQAPDAESAARHWPLQGLVGRETHRDACGKCIEICWPVEQNVAGKKGSYQRVNESIPVLPAVMVKQETWAPTKSENGIRGQTVLLTSSPSMFSSEVSLGQSLHQQHHLNQQRTPFVESGFRQFRKKQIALHIQITKCCFPRRWNKELRIILSFFGWSQIAKPHLSSHNSDLAK